MPIDWDHQFGAWGTLGENAEIARELRSIAATLRAKTAGINWHGENPCAQPYTEEGGGAGKYAQTPRLTVPRILDTLESQAFKLDRYGLKPGASAAQLKAWIAMFLEGGALLTGPAGGLGILELIRCLCRTQYRQGTPGDAGSGADVMSGRTAAGWSYKNLPMDAYGGTSCRLNAILRHWGIDDRTEWGRAWPHSAPTIDNQQGTGFKWEESGGLWLVSTPLSAFIDQGSARAEVAAKIATVAPPIPDLGKEGETILGLEKSVFWAIAAGVGGLLLLGTIVGVAKRRKRRRAYV